MFSIYSSHNTDSVLTASLEEKQSNQQMKSVHKYQDCDAASLTVDVCMQQERRLTK